MITFVYQFKTMGKTAKNTEKKLLLRLPVKLWEKIVSQSAKNNRSVNGQIVQTLQEAER